MTPLPSSVISDAMSSLGPGMVAVCVGVGGVLLAIWGVRWVLSWLR